MNDFAALSLRQKLTTLSNFNRATLTPDTLRRRGGARGAVAVVATLLFSPLWLLTTLKGGWGAGCNNIYPQPFELLSFPLLALVAVTVKQIAP